MTQFCIRSSQKSNHRAARTSEQHLGELMRTPFIVLSRFSETSKSNKSLFMMRLLCFSI